MRLKKKYNAVERINDFDVKLLSIIHLDTLKNILFSVVYGFERTECYSYSKSYNGSSWCWYNV